jgi:hypothetical protein
MARLASRGSESLRTRERTMRPICPSRHFVYALALAVILLSQQIVSQTPSSSHPSTNPTTTSDGKSSAGKVNCTNNGTYVNTKGRLFSDQRIAPGHLKEPRRSAGMEVIVSARADEALARIMAVWLSGFDREHKSLGGRECLLVVVDEHHVPGGHFFPPGFVHWPWNRSPHDKVVPSLKFRATCRCRVNR